MKGKPLSSEKRKSDVIVVLGAAVWSRGRPSPTLERRVKRGLELFHAGEADCLLFTGGLGRHPPAEAEVMRRIAIEAGVEPYRIEVETASRNTLENAVNSARIMTRRGWRSAVLVSDPVHLPRASLVFRALGVKIRPRGTFGAWKHGPFRRSWHYPLYEAAALAWYLVLILSGRHRSGRADESS